MDRNQALKLLKQHLKSENLINHSLAVEAIMRGIAERLDQDADKFGLAGLLHDIDYDTTAEPMAKPLPIAAVVFPTESRRSVVSRTSWGNSDISAIPPALSAIGP
jgi:putative nucleotidyltransferase with HDIG domain